ncbi:MAG TPA: PASTA domain-containing protein [Vicinamibacteria bacterium]
MTFKRAFLFLIKSTFLGLALLLVVGLSALGTMRVVLSSEEVVVPSVVAKSVPEAGSVAARHGLSLRVEGKRNDAKIPADHVAAQEPAAGANLKSQRSIRVWVSVGPRRVTIPTLEGGSVRTARLSLDQGQVPLLRVVEVDDPSEEGTVLQQHPIAGDVDGAVEGVSLLSSRGRVGADYLMPDLIGRPADAVLDRLRAAGLKVSEVRFRSYPGVAPGIVLRQLPAAGHRVNARAQISLDVSKVTQ